MKRFSIFFLLITTVSLCPVFAFGQDVLEENCGNPYDSGGIGPYDINDPTIPPEKIDIVVRLHFTPYMEEMAINGSTTRRAAQVEETGGQERLASNLDYTLRAIPNHARALYAMGMWQLRLREQSMDEFLGIKLIWNFKSAECYFKRAIMFSPGDGQVYLAYAIFRHKQGNTELALENYREAIRLMPDAAEAHYSIGLLYVEMKEFAAARQHAWKAYELGYPLPGLRNALQRRGEWQAAPQSSGESAP